MVGLWKAVQQNRKLAATLARDQSLKSLSIGLYKDGVAKGVSEHGSFLSPSL
jgi:hypothetical protein